MIGGIGGIGNNSTQSLSAGSQAGGSGGGSGGDDLLGKAEAIAREGFELSLKAKQITNKYAAAKEVR
ncbi:hypothetical protein HX793_04600 [Pseudomonas reactans]|uniref:hypothetical protein n=1 Tax=Pseudomonas reactans TaxID=117680 RepID=UPI00030AD962|nr:hypothetical protein [Pseudomonas reactans]NWC86437.1 hypothetical protein [Pseudomonas reactans]NWD29039.1 hypothetical protein [Pseudomonas reactans]NWF12984.1 hypothetical protein [Pseudomonas reactans]